MKPPPSFPGPNASDNDEVSWALCTAAALWKLGKYRDAVNWVQTAAKEAAGAESHPDSNVRVVQLTIAVTELSQYVAEWERGQDADPKSVAISIDFDTESIDIDSEGAPVPPPKAPEPPKLAPRAKTFAGTLPQDARTPLMPTATVAPKIEDKKVEPRKGSPSLSRTLPEAMSSPLARRPSTAGPIGQKPRTPDAQPVPLVLDLGAKKPVSSDPFASLDEARLTTPTPEEPALTKRMDDVPTRRIGEGEAWPPADIDEDDEPKRKP